LIILVSIVDPIGLGSGSEPPAELYRFQRFAVQTRKSAVHAGKVCRAKRLRRLI
jgi:hypothetical protein